MEWPLVLDEGAIGAQALSALALERATGVLTWSGRDESVRLYLRSGRPEATLDEAGGLKRDKSAVQNLVRGMACVTNGLLTFDPKEIAIDDSFGMDTLGLVLVALVRAATPQSLGALWQKQRDAALEATASFDKVSGALAQIGADNLAKSDMTGPVAAVTMRLGDARLGALTALWVLGGLKLTKKAAATVSAASAPAKPAAASNPVLERIDVVFASLDKQSHYEILGVADNVSAEDIRKAYYEAAKLWHSDHFSGTELGERVRKVEAIFVRVNEALKILSDAKERSNYDFLLGRKRKGLPTDVNVIMEADTIFRRAQALVRRGQAPAAEPLLQKALEMNKGESDFWAYWGYAYFCAKGTESFPEAKKAIDEALKLNEKSDAAYEFLGRMARVTGDNAAAQRHFKKCLELNPRNRDAERELRLIEMRGTHAPDRIGSKPGLLSRILGR